MRESTFTLVYWGFIPSFPTKGQLANLLQNWVLRLDLHTISIFLLKEKSSRVFKNQLEFLDWRVGQHTFWMNNFGWLSLSCNVWIAWSLNCHTCGRFCGEATQKNQSKSWSHKKQKTKKAKNQEKLKGCIEKYQRKRKFYKSRKLINETLFERFLIQEWGSEIFRNNEFWIPPHKESWYVIPPVMSNPSMKISFFPLKWDFEMEMFKTVYVGSNPPHTGFQSPPGWHCIFRTGNPNLNLYLWLQYIAVVSFHFSGNFPLPSFRVTGILGGRSSVINPLKVWMQVRQPPRNCSNSSSISPHTGSCLRQSLATAPQTALNKTRNRWWTVGMQKHGESDKARVHLTEIAAIAELFLMLRNLVIQLKMTWNRKSTSTLEIFTSFEIISRFPFCWTFNLKQVPAFFRPLKGDAPFYLPCSTGSQGKNSSNLVVSTTPPWKFPQDTGVSWFRQGHTKGWLEVSGGWWSSKIILIGLVFLASQHMGVSKNMFFFPPKWMVYFMENLTKMDDLGPTPIFGNTYIQALPGYLYISSLLFVLFFCLDIMCCFIL